MKIRQQATEQPVGQRRNQKKKKKNTVRQMKIQPTKAYATKIVLRRNT